LQDSNTKTNLETLVFEECNIEAGALKLILSRPKALKRLTLGERIHHFHSSPPGYLIDHGPQFAAALAEQANSLEYFKQTQHGPRPIYLLPTESRHLYVLSDSLPEMPMLKEFDVPYGSPLCAIATKLPPRLQKVRLHHTPRFAYEVQALLLRILPRELRILENKSVKHLEMVLYEARTNREDTQEEWLAQLLSQEDDSGRYPWAAEGNRDSIWALGRKLSQHGIRLTVNWIRSAGFIPPFMHGEILPTEFKIYDSDQPDVFGSLEMGKWSRDSECAARIRNDPHWKEAYGVLVEELD
jgi:hypothetical protein